MTDCRVRGMSVSHLAIAAVVLSLVLLGLDSAAGQALRPGQMAPEITGEPWINSQPLTMAGLRGRVVLIEFWTYG